MSINFALVFLCFNDNNSKLFKYILRYLIEASSGVYTGEFENKIVNEAVE